MWLLQASEWEAVKSTDSRVLLRGMRLAGLPDIDGHGAANAGLALCLPPVYHGVSRQPLVLTSWLPSHALPARLLNLGTQRLAGTDMMRHRALEVGQFSQLHQTDQEASGIL